MSRSGLWIRVGVLLCSLAITGKIAPQNATEVQNIEYLRGVPGNQEGMSGSLRISATQIVFTAKAGNGQFVINNGDVEYVAAQAQAKMRARTADTGVTVAGLAALAVLGGWTPVPLLFHKAEKHLLSLEYLDKKEGTRQLALFDVHDHSALAVKKIIDTELGLTTDYYRNKDREEEERQREMEAHQTPAGYWDTTKNTMVGDSRYDQILVEAGKYAVLFLGKYVGFRPDGVRWATYRVPVREVKPARSDGEKFAPIYKSSRLVGFKTEGKQYVFY